MTDNRSNTTSEPAENTPENNAQLDPVTYVKQAESIILSLDRNRFGKPDLSTNQLRNIHTMITELYNMVSHYEGEELSEAILSHVQYTRMKIAYSAGRDGKVKCFVLRSRLMEYLDAAASRSELMLVCHYSEALVAYHKFYHDEND